MKEILNKILNIIIIITILAILGLIGFKLFSQDNGIDKYQKGMELYNQEDFSNAYYNFVRVPKNSKYYNFALFRQGMCAEKLADNETQAQKYEEYSQKNHDFLTFEALYKSGVGYFNNNDFNNAEKMFKKAIKSPIEPDNEISDYSIAANYFLGQIYEEKKPIEALNYYLSYLKFVTDGKFSNQCAQNALNIIKNNKISLNEEDNYYLAKTLYEHGYYSNASEFFEKSKVDKAWNLKALNYMKQGQNEKALALLQEGITHYYKNMNYEDLSAAINNFVKLYSPDTHEGWRTLSDTLSGTSFGALDEILYNLNEYQKIFNLNLKGKYAEKSLFDMFFKAYDKKDYNLARVYGNNFAQRFPQSIYAPKVLYYLGNTYERLFKKAEATQTYNRLMVNYQDSFWAFRAFTKTRQNKSQFADWTNLGYAKIDVPQINPDFPYDEIPLSKNNAALLNLLIKIHDYDIIEKVASKNLAIKSWTNFKKGNYSISVLYARDYLNSLEVKPDFKNSLYVLAYPILYNNEINKYTETNNLNGFLIESLIREESYFNPNAKSSVGALGLMQLMPATASFIANSQVPTSKLSEPDYNIYLGTKYFGYAKNILENNDVYAVLAYNGGPGAVQNWIKRHGTSDIDEFIEKIPYDETQYYILKIYRSFWNYINIYKPDKL